MKNIIDQNDQLEIEAAVFHRLVNHLQSHNEVQNMDLMILADFCRNCLAKWYRAAALERDIQLDYETAREFIYGMPYGEWKEKYQTDATPEQKQAYEAAKAKK